MYRLKINLNYYIIIIGDRMNKKNQIIETILIQIAIILLTIFCYMKFQSNILLIFACVIASLINILSIKYEKNYKKIINKIIDYRYLVGLIIFVICVLFKLHGSSIEYWNNIFPDNVQNTSNVIFGNDRGIRSDEWNVHTPYYMSQVYNNFKLYNDKVSLSGQNMILGYNAPVLDPTVIAKPFTWGYILLGNEYGLSWYWCMKLILLCLLSYETAMIITNKNKKLSILGVFLIAFGPAMQWWFVPHMCDVFFWAMAIFVVGYNFFTAKNKLIKNITSILAPSAIIGFVLALFPSLQVPLGIIAIILLIVSLIRDREQITFEKKDIIRILIIGLVIVSILGYFAYTSLDDIKILNSTVYPGARLETGGGQNITDLFTDLTTIFLPYKAIPYLNECEASTFIHFGPFFLLLFPFLFLNLKKQKKSTIVGLTLAIILIIQIIFMIFGFPLWLSKLTLFKYINRMKIVYGFVSILFTLWSINKIWNNKNIISKKIYIPLTVLFGIIYYLLITPEQLSYITLKNLILEIIVFITILLLIIYNKKKLVISGLMLLIVMSSFTINPIATGIAPIKNHQMSKEIKEIIKNDDGRFISIGDWSVGNFLLANGAKVVNAVNFYPDMKKWELLDPDGLYDEVYNRYAHIEMHLTTDENSFKISTPDSIEIAVSYDELKKLDVKYIIANEKINMNLKNISFENLYYDESSNFTIYKINYN